MDMEDTAGISLQWAIDAFMGDAVHYAKETRENCKYILSQFIRTVGNRKIISVGQREVRTYFFGRDDGEGAKGRLAPSTFNHHRLTLHTFFDYCVHRGWQPANPITVHSVPKQKPGAEPKVFLTAAQLHEALETRKHPRDRAVLAVAMNTGLRAAEMRNLRIGDVDLSRGVVRVKVAKGNKRDEMPITADLDAELRRWLTFYTDDVGDMHATTCNQWFGKMRVCGMADWHKPLCREWHLLPAKTKGMYGTGGVRAETRLKPETRYGRIRATCNNALLDLGVRTLDEDGHTVDGRGTGCHTWRRSAAQALLQHLQTAGDNHESLDPSAALMAVSRFLHHSSVTTTERYLNIDHYTAIRDANLKGRNFIPRADTSNITELVRGA